MRVALNAQLLSSAASYRAAGINRVLQQLLAELPAVPGDEQYLIYAPYSEANRRLLARPRVRPRLTRLPVDRPPVRIAWEQTVLPVELLREGADLLHALGFVSPVAWRGQDGRHGLRPQLPAVPGGLQPGQPVLPEHVHAAVSAAGGPRHHDLRGRRVATSSSCAASRPSR